MSQRQLNAVIVAVAHNLHQRRKSTKKRNVKYWGWGNKSETRNSKGEGRNEIRWRIIIREPKDKERKETTASDTDTNAIFRQRLERTCTYIKPITHMDTYTHRYTSISLSICNRYKNHVYTSTCNTGQIHIGPTERTRKPAETECRSMVPTGNTPFTLQQRRDQQRANDKRSRKTENNNKHAHQENSSGIINNNSTNEQTTTRTTEQRQKGQQPQRQLSAARPGQLKIHAFRFFRSFHTFTHAVK